MEKKKYISNKKVFLAFGILVAIVFSVSFLPSFFAKDLKP